MTVPRIGVKLVGQSADELSKLLGAMREAGLAVDEFCGGPAGGAHEVTVAVELPAAKAPERERVEVRVGCLDTWTVECVADALGGAGFDVEPDAVPSVNGYTLGVTLPDEAGKDEPFTLGTKYWRNRAEKAEAALAAHTKQPSAGDRVRGLTSAMRMLAREVDRRTDNASEVVDEILPLIAAELDKQDAAGPTKIEYRFKYSTADVEAAFHGKTGDVASAKAGSVEFADIAKSVADAAKAATAAVTHRAPQPDTTSSLWAAAYASVLLACHDPMGAKKQADSVMEATKGHEVEREKIASLIEARLLDGWAEAAK